MSASHSHHLYLYRFFHHHWPLSSTIVTHVPQPPVHSPSHASIRASASCSAPASAPGLTTPACHLLPHLLQNLLPFDPCNHTSNKSLPYTIEMAPKNQKLPILPPVHPSSLSQCCWKNKVQRNNNWQLTWGNSFTWGACRCDNWHGRRLFYLWDGGGTRQ